ncbi:MAG: hypothetical protein COX57_06340 [Alphaproteobacteria bacterium CG_4_10_14_0_2_um_filter_63_37]|nr:MAG: hypothetical protein AUJ55_01820 [Proteobacteria bacterium CG1_02_64_396]PJA24932.1 MAG: hypothetical protein COX57_06340 [Alphaproteobacteria bacterium CG_4_10_14_0_2_um_filter_63_37]
MNKLRFAPAIRLALVCAVGAMGTQAGASSLQVTDNRMNPAVSLIVWGQYSQASHNQPLTLPGMPLGGEAGAWDRGFALRESELSLSAMVDPHFYAFAALAIAPEGGLSAEEAYGETTDLPGGVQLRFGRFFSALAYNNDRHAHVWSFNEPSLPYQAFLGNQYGDMGVRAAWLLPTPGYAELFVEGFSGERYPTAGRVGGQGAKVVALRLGGDLNDETSWLGNLGYLDARSQDRLEESDSQSFTGHGHVAAASLVLTWAPDGNPLERNLKVVIEAMQRREAGASVDAATGGALASGTRSQTGYAVEGVYQWRQGWEGGLRFDVVGLAEQIPTGMSGGSTPASRLSAMTTWRGSEFSKVRLEASQEWTGRGTGDAPNTRVTLDYMLSLGAHGAHAF